MSAPERLYAYINKYEEDKDWHDLSACKELWNPDLREHLTEYIRADLARSPLSQETVETLRGWHLIASSDASWADLEPLFRKADLARLLGRILTETEGKQP